MLMIPLKMLLSLALGVRQNADFRHSLKSSSFIIIAEMVTVTCVIIYFVVELEHNKLPMYTGEGKR